MLPDPGRRRALLEGRFAAARRSSQWEKSDSESVGASELGCMNAVAREK
jgi:hypothetical protein